VIVSAGVGLAAPTASTRTDKPLLTFKQIAVVVAWYG